MQECTKRNVSTETKFRFHVFQDERFVDLNLYQYGWEQTEPLHSYGPYTKNPNPSPIEKRFGFSILTAVLPLDIPMGWEPRGLTGLRLLIFPQPLGRALKNQNAAPTTPPCFCRRQRSSSLLFKSSYPLLQLKREYTVK